MQSAKEAIKQNGFLLHTIKGISMTPLLNQETDIVKLIAPPEKLQLNDIVLFSRDGLSDALVLHRLIKFYSDGSYGMCGDHQVEIEKVTPDHVIGVAQGYYHGEEYIVLRDEAGPVIATDYEETLNAHSREVIRKAPYWKLRHFLGRIYHKIKGDR